MAHVDLAEFYGVLTQQIYFSYDPEWDEETFFRMFSFNLDGAMLLTRQDFEENQSVEDALETMLEYEHSTIGNGEVLEMWGI